MSDTRMKFAGTVILLDAKTYAVILPGQFIDDNHVTAGDELYCDVYYHENKSQKWEEVLHVVKTLWTTQQADFKRGQIEHRLRERGFSKNEIAAYWFKLVRAGHIYERRPHFWAMTQ